MICNNSNDPVLARRVAGQRERLSSFLIVDPQGNVVNEARLEKADLLLAEIDAETGE